MCYNIGNGGALDQRMGRTLEQYVSEAEGAYQPAVDALNSQLSGLGGQLEETNNRINKDYAQQRARLNNQRNDAAYNASMQAAGSGGSFGGAANIANRKYYSQSFVPAVTQMNTNHSNDLSSARQSYDNQRLSLESQLANMRANAKQQALQAYYAADEAEKNRQFQAAQNAANQALQREQIASNNRIAELQMQAAKEMQTRNNAANSVKTWDFGDGWSVQDNNGQAAYFKDGVQKTAGEFLAGTRANTNWDLWNDIWNNGVKTNGVGSDTIDAYYKANPQNMSLQDMLSFNNRFNYLYA